MVIKQKLKQNKKTVSISACAIIVILAIGTIIAVSRPKKAVIAFYNIPEQSQQTLQNMLGNNFAYETYSTDRPLAWELEQHKKPAAVITPSGKALDDARAISSPKISLEPDVLKDTTTSIKTLTVTSKSKDIKALPLLSSHLEIAIQTQELKKSGVKNINSWNDIERFARAAKEKNGTSILFAGKDGAAFLDILGAMTEALSGTQNYENAIQLIEIAIDKITKTTEFDAQRLAQSLAGTPFTPLYDAVQILNRWYKEGLLFSELFSLDQKSVAALMENKIASAVIMTLEEHRAVNRAIIEKYASIYFPSNTPAYSRSFTAPVYFATPLKNSAETIGALKALLEPNKQEQLSRATGLAPVLARCRTPDKQSDDARYWVAATNSPLAGLSRDVALTHSQRDLLAAELAALVRFGNY